jgi:hypothetical protein
MGVTPAFLLPRRRGRDEDAGVTPALQEVRHVAKTAADRWPAAEFVDRRLTGLAPPKRRNSPRRPSKERASIALR